MTNYYDDDDELVLAFGKGEILPPLLALRTRPTLRARPTLFSLFDSASDAHEGEHLFTPPTRTRRPCNPFATHNNADFNVMSSTDSDAFGGLGINFYQVDGRTKSAGDDKKRAAAGSSTGRAPSLEALAQQQQQPPQPPPLPIDENKFETSLALTDQLLEEQYRGQAESFTRHSSRSPSLSSALISPPINTSATFTPPLPLLSRKASSSIHTPTRQPSKFQSFAQRKFSLATSGASGNKQLVNTASSRRIVSSPAPLNLRSYSLAASTNSGLSPQLGGSKAPFSPHYGHQIRSVSGPVASAIDGSRSKLYYFTEEERTSIAEAVEAKRPLCDHHEDCINCLNKEYAYFENKIMPTSMPPEERQKIINNNRSLRNIKNELEHLIEQGIISDQQYDTIMNTLPSESPLNGSLVPRNDAARSPSPAAPIDHMANLNISGPPPAYTNAGPPPTPARNPTPQPPQKPEIARAVALYRYAEPEDCNFEVGDHISVYEYMNAEWWLGRNLRTGKEGVFPMNYVQVQAQPRQGSFYGEQKQNTGGYPGQPQYAQQGPPAPGPSNPYNSAVPPMAVAEGGQNEPNKPSKGGEMGKKFGKKLGNAAIFGAGATIGGNIVNSIF